MTWLLIHSYLTLLWVDLRLRLTGLNRLHQWVKRQMVRSPKGCGGSVETLCRAVELASVFYFKRVMCLQRSAATTAILRRHGWKAEMVIGAQLSPFKSHAWVEVDHAVVNDKPYIVDIYQVLDRC